jgi:hypothetical protein
MVLVALFVSYMMFLFRQHKRGDFEDEISLHETGKRKEVSAVKLVTFFFLLLLVLFFQVIL